MISETQIEYESELRRQGSSRRLRAYQASNLRRSLTVFPGSSMRLGMSLSYRTFLTAFSLHSSLFDDFAIKAN
jgi:hypothetical protein